MERGWRGGGEGVERGWVGNDVVMRWVGWVVM